MVIFLSTRHVASWGRPFPPARNRLSTTPLRADWHILLSKGSWTTPNRTPERRIDEIPLRKNETPSAARMMITMIIHRMILLWRPVQPKVKSTSRLCLSLSSRSPFSSSGQSRPMSSTHLTLLSRRLATSDFCQYPWFFSSLSTRASQGARVCFRAYIAAWPAIHGSFLSRVPRALAPPLQESPVHEELRHRTFCMSLL